jgi:hypothetical protein
VLYFIGICFEISFTDVWKECKCGTCGNAMGSVSSVGFYRCRWSYWGVVEAGEEVREDFRYAYGFTVCSSPKRFKWKSLCLAAWELTKEEQEAAHTYVLTALETPLISRKRGRDEEVREVAEKKEADTQTDTPSFPLDGAEHMNQTVVITDQLINQLKATVRLKEDRYTSLQTQVTALVSDISTLKHPST